MRETMKITELKINGITRPMGYDFSHVTICWRVEDSMSPSQEKSHILITLDKAGKQVVCEKRGVLSCAGTAMDVSLRPRTTYYVSVTVTGTLGDTASGATSFETGKMDEPWTARWIGPPEGSTFHPILSKTFSLSKEVVRARLYICGVGLYEASLNGRKIGEDVLSPFFNDYRCALQAQTYEVEGLLAGENTLSIALGNGWYKGRLGYNGSAGVYGSQFAAIGELHLEFLDGSRETVLTDESWIVQPGDTTYSDIYDGEGVDRTLFSAGRPAYPAIPVDMSGKQLTDRYSMPLRVMEQLPVKEVILTPAGETVLDFGQNFAGFVSFHVKNFTPGTVITLEHGEVLQQGNFYHDNYRTARTLITYVSDGTEEWYTPTFTYMGFRYVKVSGWPGPVDPKDFVGKVVYSAMERTGFLSTGHQKVNRLISNALWGLKSNFLDMPTDCPQRDERLGWTGDAQVFAATASFFMDTRAFYRKFLWDMRGDQLRHDGAVASYLPNFDGAPMGAAVWADAATIIPETVFDAFADAALLREAYPLMKDWVDFVTRQDIRRGQRYLYDFAFTFGDWLAMDGVTEQSMKGGTEDAFVACVYYYASVKKTARAAEILGKTDDAAAFYALAERIRGAILREYFTPAGRLAIDTQAGYIICLHFGIWVDKAVLREGLRRRLKRDGNRIRCGFVGAPLICETLAENGMMELAMHLFLQEKFPSWLHCVNLGATTIWERWNSLLDDGSISGTGMNSLNHYAYGSVVNFAVKYLAGLTPLQPGYRKVRIQPAPDPRLGKLELTYRSASGVYVAHWRIRSDGALEFHFEIPFDCQAEVLLPEAGQPITLTAGSYDFAVTPKRDYRCLYTMDTILDEVTGDEKAMEILREELPDAFGMAMSGDVEVLSATFRELAEQPWFGFPAPLVEKAMARLSQIHSDRIS